MPPTIPRLLLLLTVLEEAYYSIYSVLQQIEERHMKQASGAAAGQNDCGNCLHLDSGAIVGIITCDVIITLLIAGMAFWVSNNVLKKKYEEKLKEKNSATTNEHTYEHLRNHTSDIYNDLSSRRN